MKMLKRATGRWAAILAASALATGVAASAHAESIKMMGWVGLFDFQKAGWERIVSDFEAQNPGVTIEYIGTPFEDTLNQATVAILGNNAPDVIQIASSWVPQLAGMGALEPLSDHLPADEIAQFPKASLDAATIDSKVLALDWLPGPISMGYNRTLMKKAGLDPDSPPKTWDEFTNAVDKICALGGDGDAKIYGVSLRTARNPNSAHWALPIIWANGGSVVDESGKVSFNNDGVRKAFDWYRDVIRRGCSQEAFDIQGSRNVFAQGRAGFIFEGPWLRGLVEKLSGGKLSVAPEGDVWIAPVPAAADGKVKQIENSNMLVMTKQAKNKKLAAKFISFVLGNKDTVEYFYETSQQLTTGRLDILKQGKMGADPYIQAFVDTLPVSDPLPINNPQVNAILDAVTPALQSIIQGGDANDELSNADREIDRTLGQ
ncbi:sugar ABC transporter substrate-binding protein [Mesorhizobium sp. BAC0120]|uniref:ABC transporter substrate-binding protein n=1 Tax=Mesorhizobium sp. BAC0120 TaxID=3090670 RepID=UPI00298C3B2D|nr:sugar ABC transporter substrate-binding protein [Mesorhizobium sp. BAC0120]MDW6021622.1 sugar ABC transporter substrate-binding protein [Mesorhizobium sp. BAC0120]